MYLEKPICVEVNGVFHYPRNSEEPLGKERMKERILTELEGMQMLTLPYYDTVLLEDDAARAKYTHACIGSLCQIK